MNDLKERAIDPKENGQGESELLSNFLAQHFAGQKETLNFLEAGCGKSWDLKPSGVPFHLTGVDLSREALEMRKSVTQDLNEGIVGDLRTVQIEESSHHLIYCSFVLEHIDGAERVLDRFFSWLRPGGLLILLIPDRDTVVGLLTRLTPYWLHVYYYRYMRKKINAGKPGHGPFPTYYDRIVSMRGIRDYCARHEYKIRIEKLLKLNTKKVFGPLAPLFVPLTKFVEIASFRKLASEHNNLLYLIEKPDSL